MQYKLIGCAIIIVLIIILIYCYYNSVLYEEYLEGYWSTSDDFNEKAEVQYINMYIGRAESGLIGMRREGHIHSPSITNTPMTMTYSRALSGPREYNISVKFEYEEGAPWPEELNMQVKLVEGIMKLYKDGEIYGIFYKQVEFASYM